MIYRRVPANNQLSIINKRFDMSQIERVGVSLEKELLGAFDKLIADKGYQSRSEAIRDLIRQQLSDSRLTDEKAEVVAAVVLVYDHHATAIMERLTELQHSHFLKTISSLHVHLDHHDCLEVIVLRGKVGEINKMGEKLISIKGVKLGRVNLLANEGL
jgi:CopG family transcriptional regulator, nickel-responsive regulator